MPTVPLMGNRFYWQQKAGTGEILLDFMAQGLRFRLPSFYCFLSSVIQKNHDTAYEMRGFPEDLLRDRFAHQAVFDEE